MNPKLQLAQQALALFLTANYPGVESVYIDEVYGLQVRCLDGCNTQNIPNYVFVNFDGTAGDPGATANLSNGVRVTKRAPAPRLIQKGDEDFVW